MNTNNMNSNILIRKRAPVYLLMAIIIGLALRLYHLGKFGLWFDEAGPAYIIKYLKTCYVLNIFHVDATDIWKRSFLILLKLWMRISYDDYSLRLFSVLWAILSIIMIYRVGKYIFSKEAGILSALLLSVSPFHIYYSQELTCYSLSVFLVLCSSYYFLRFLKSQRLLSACLYAIATLGLVYTHHINLVFILTQNIFFYAFYSKDALLRRKWLRLQLILFLLLIPWLVTVVSKFLLFTGSNTYYWIPKPDLRALLQTYMVFSLGYHTYWPLQLIALGIFLYFSINTLYYWHKKIEAYYLIFWMAIPVGSVWIISQFSPFYLHRTFLSVLPAFYLLSAPGIVKTKRYLASGLIVIYAILAAVSLNNYYENRFNDYAYWGGKLRYPGVVPKKDFKQAAMYVAENFQQGDIIFHICRSSLVPFIYYHRSQDYPEYGIRLKENYKEDWLRSWSVPNAQYYLHPEHITGKPKYITRLLLNIENKEDLNKYKRVWLVHSSWYFEGEYKRGNDIIDQNIINWFDEHFSRRGIKMFKGIGIYLYEKSGENK
jgi:mannosyltransferase